MSTNLQVVRKEKRCCRTSQFPEEDAPFVVGRSIVPI
jgi:hypothetical protein